MEIPKWYSSNFWKIAAGVVAIIAPVISGFAFIDGGGMISYYCSTHNQFLGLDLYKYILCPVYVALGYIVIVSIVLTLIPLIGYWFYNFFSKKPYAFISWIKTPRSENLHIFSGSMRGNVFTIKFIYTEWRHLFKKTDALLNIQHLKYLNTASDNGGENLEWREQRTTEPIFINRFMVYEANLIKIDPKEKVFWVLTEKNKVFRFPAGKYGFEIWSLCNVYGARTIWQTHHIIIEYKAPNKITIKNVKREDYEKEIWIKKLPQETKDYP